MQKAGEVAEKFFAERIPYFIRKIRQGIGGAGYLVGKRGYGDAYDQKNNSEDRNGNDHQDPKRHHQGRKVMDKAQVTPYERFFFEIRFDRAYERKSGQYQNKQVKERSGQGRLKVKQGDNGVDQKDERYKRQTDHTS